MDELVAKARVKQPGLIVVDRAVYGKNQNYLTPENRVPEKALPYPWESCIIAGGGWAWVPDPKFMSPRDAVHLLVDIVVKGGNLLLNIGPAPDGTWPEEAYTLLAEMGRWMKVNGEAIYGTRALAPHKDGKTCITRKGDDTRYLYYMAGEGEQMPASVNDERSDSSRRGEGFGGWIRCCLQVEERRRIIHCFCAAVCPEQTAVGLCVGVQD
jgi:alpha-L-fucosidase